MELLNHAARATNIDAASPGILLLDQSCGWLRSAEWIARGAKTGPRAGIFGVLPALFALWQGVELFLKGASEALVGQYNNESHDLDVLLTEYTAAIAGRPELMIKADVNRMICWDQNCRRDKKSRLPHGSDLRFILNRDNLPSWPDVDIDFDQIVELSRDYRRDFCRIRRIIFGVKGFAAFWEEGTFASEYPGRPFWFFCVLGSTHTLGCPGPWEHVVRDDVCRSWIALEGEAVDEQNLSEVTIEPIPPHVRIECSLNELPTRLSQETITDTHQTIRPCEVFVDLRA